MRLALCLATLLLATFPGQAQKSIPRTGTYASVNAYEKVCLRLNNNQRFAMFSSSCSIDRAFEGRWTSRGDTLILNADNGPAMILSGATETPGPAKRTRVQVLASDPLLLSGLMLRSGTQQTALDASGSAWLEQPLELVELHMQGLRPLTYRAVDPAAAALDLDIRFQNLDRPSLVNDRWLVRGKHLNYLPGPQSSRSAEIRLKRGKRCFYKDPL
jgi:hypothetical protein